MVQIEPQKAAFRMGFIAPQIARVNAAGKHPCQQIGGYRIERHAIRIDPVHLIGAAVQGTVVKGENLVTEFYRIEPVVLLPVFADAVGRRIVQVPAFISLGAEGGNHGEL